MPLEKANRTVTGEFLRQRPGFLRIAHTDNNFCRARLKKPPKNSTCRAARPQKHHTLSCERKTPCFQCADKTRRIRIAAFEPSLFQHDRIDRANGTGRRIHLIEKRYDGRLVRNRHVETAKPQRSEPANRFRKILGRHGKRDIGKIQSRFLQGGILHHRRKGMGNRPPDDSKILCPSTKHHCIPFHCIKKKFFRQ